jgi:putative protease
MLWAMMSMVRNRRAELLSPAGNWDCVRAAVAAGADAVYFGLPRFNARLRADNFTESDLPDLMDYLHKHGRRGFATMNTLIFTGELEAAEAQLRLLGEAGVDAIIVQDLGLARLAHALVPEVELHASTQMTITSPEGLAFVEGLFPLERAVLARELSIKEIGRFRAEAEAGRVPTRTPLEVFVHGALCVAYSGQCLTSESLGQRSANRGECAQACRMPYELIVDGEVRALGEQRYLLSPQDLAAVDRLPELLRAGVVSFKIEGRLKSPEYVAAVTRVYRKALDAALLEAPAPVTAEDRYSLEMTFSRGLSTGWLDGTNHPYLTHGRFGKKRGPLAGVIARTAPGWVELEGEAAVPLAPGDGVVFDAGENRDHEQGARIWKVEGRRLRFHLRHSGLDFGRIQPGQRLHKTSDPALDAELRRFWRTARPEEKKIPLRLRVEGRVGEPLALEAQTGHGSARVVSDQALTAADKHALSTATLAAQLGRLGETPYCLDSLENALEGDCHLPLSALNHLRRAVVAALGDPRLARRKASRRDAAPSLADLLPVREAPAVSPHGHKLSVLARTLEQVRAVAAGGMASELYCDFEDPRRYAEAVAVFRGESAAPEARIHLATPRILKPGETGYLKLIAKARPDGVLLRNLAALAHYREEEGLARIGDFSLNVANPLTAALLRQAAGLERMTVSYDLNITQALDLLQAAPPDWFELTLHQHMPMFHMEHCVFCAFLSEGTTWKDCGRPCEKHVVHLRDRVGQLHRLQADVGCRNTLFNGRAQTGARYFEALARAGLSHFRVELLDEDAPAAARTVRAYRELLDGHLDPEDLLGRVRAMEKLGVTEGTLAAKV